MSIQPHKSIILLYLIASAFIIAFFTSLYIAIPSLRKPLANPDQILDTVTVGVFFLASAVGVYYAFTISNLWYRLIYLLIPIASFVLLLDELGYGVHQLIRRDVWRIGLVNTITMIAPVIAVIALGGFVIILYLRQFDNFGIWIQHNIPIIFFVMAFVGFMVIAVVLDSKYLLSRSWSMVFVEELAEALMAVSLLFCSLHIRQIADYVSHDQFTPHTTSHLIRFEHKK